MILYTNPMFRFAGEAESQKEGHVSGPKLCPGVFYPRYFWKVPFTEICPLLFTQGVGQEAEGRGDVRVPRLQERGVRHDAGQGGRQEEDRQDVLPRHGAAAKVWWTIFYLNLMFQLKHRAILCVDKMWRKCPSGFIFSFKLILRKSFKVWPD